MSTLHTDITWMQQALQMAQEANAKGEVPIGALLVKEGHVIARAHNQCIERCDPTAHAEMEALRRAGQVLQNYRLIGTTLDVTLEPCYMCLTAAIHARIERLVFGAYDSKHNATRFIQQHTFNHKVVLVGGVLEEECQHLLHAFFAARR